MYSYAKSILKDQNITINHYRQNCDKTVLNGFYFITNLPTYMLATLGSKTSQVKLSIDNLLKNMIEHPEITFVIKKTKNGCENFLTTFHKANIKQLNKDIARYKQIKR